MIGPLSLRYPSTIGIAINVNVGSTLTRDIIIGIKADGRKPI